MKSRIAVLFAALLFVCAAAFAGRLSIYSNAALSDCTLLDASPGVVHVYVADSGSIAGEIGSRFRIAASTGFTGAWLSETTPYVHLGNSQTDFSVAYGYCVTEKILVLDMTYQVYGTSTCSTLSIAPPIGFPMPFCDNCGFDGYPCAGYDPLHVNCPGPFSCGPVAVESSTWGRVKALYRD